MSDEIKVNIREHDKTAIIDLIGDVTTFAEEPIVRAYNSQKDAQNILLNFRENDYINSAGIAIIIGIVTEIKKNNQQLLISGLSQHFQKIFHMVGLTQYAKIFPTEQEALASLEQTN